MDKVLRARDVEIGVTGEGAAVGFRFALPEGMAALALGPEHLPKLVSFLMAAMIDPELRAKAAESTGAEPQRSSLALPTERVLAGIERFGETVALSFFVPGGLDLTFHLAPDKAELLAQGIAQAAEEARRTQAQLKTPQ